MTEGSQTALRTSLGNTRAGSEKRGEIRIYRRRAANSSQIARRLKAGENRIGDFASRHTLFPVARWDVARPVADILHPEAILCSKKNCCMSVLAFAYLPGPKDFHDIDRLRLIKVVEALAKSQFIEETGGTRPIYIRATPHSS